MVDNNVAYGRDNRASSFSDGDPLAELARIVGFDEKPVHVAPATRAATPANAPVRREPEFNLEDELLREFDRYDAPASGVDSAVEPPQPAAPRPVPPAPAILQSVAARGMATAPREEYRAPEPDEQPEERYVAPQQAYASPAAHVAQDDFPELEVDLASELEQAMDMAPSAPLSPVVEAARQPAPFVAAPRPMSLATPVAPKPQQAAPSRNDTLSPMEELLYDVERYSLTSRGETNGAAPVLQSPVAFTADEPQRAEPVQPVEPPQPVRYEEPPRPVAAAQFAPAPRPAVQVPVMPVPVAVPQQRVEPHVEARQDRAAAVDDSFDDSGFELALDDMEIDLDLSDIADVEQNTVEEMRTAPASGLDFDPGQIGETDDAPEAIAEVDVPALPVHEPEARPVRKAEEDFDIDSELAVLFNPQKAPGGISRQHGRAPAAAAPGVAASAPGRPPAGEDDEFERALEEDFRRSLNAPIDNDVDAGHSMPPINPANIYEDDAGRRPRWIVPAAAAFVVLAAGGVYAFMNHGGATGSSSSSGPVVIAAEKGPLKVVPENPGGKTVPNQDKAVYDRVAGGEPSRPGQESLISTNEQPVDVVQRTLQPENFPSLEGEGEDELVAVTPVGETEDERLLPRGEQRAQTPEEAPVSVSPRKVRTMIVKPDGTLVAQEVPVEAAPVQHAAATPQQHGNAATSGLAAPSGEAAPAIVSTTTAPVAHNAPAAPPADTRVAAVPPAQNGARDTAPVPSMRPSDQPANVVATVTSAGNVSNGAPITGSTPVQETAAVSTASPGGYYIQVASLPSEAEAQRSYKNLSGKFGNVIAGRGVDIKRADIAGKGTYYRVRIPAGDKAAAVALCERYRQAGGTCIVAQ